MRAAIDCCDCWTKPGNVPTLTGTSTSGGLARLVPVNGSCRCPPSKQEWLALHARRDRHAKPGQDGGCEIELVEQGFGRGAFAASEPVEGKVLHLIVMAAMMSAVGLAMIGRDDDLVAILAPARQEGCQLRVDCKAGRVHLRAIMAIAVTHAVERAGVQDTVVDCMALDQHGERCEQIEIAGGHLVLMIIARHRVKPAMMDGSFRFVIFDVAHHIEGRTLKEGRPERMRHGTRLAAGL